MSALKYTLAVAFGVAGTSLIDNLDSLRAITCIDKYDSEIFKNTTDFSLLAGKILVSSIPNKQEAIEQLIKIQETVIELYDDRPAAVKACIGSRLPIAGPAMNFTL